MKYSTDVLVLMVVMSAPLGGQADSLRVRFIGNAAFELTDGQTTLVTDFPYQSGAFGYMTYDDSVMPVGHVTRVVTHGHADHFTPALVSGGDWRVIGPPDVMRSLPPTQRISGTRQWSVGHFAVTAQPTPHSNVDHFSYVIEWRGHRFYFTGDTEDTAALVAAADLDVAFVTPWLWCTVLRSEQSVSATRVVMHHQFPAGRSEICGSPVVLEQGQELVFTPR